MIIDGMLYVQEAQDLLSGMRAVRIGVVFDEY